MFLIDQKLQKTKIDSQRILTTRYFLPSYAVKLIFGGLLSHIDDCWHKYLICWEMVGVRFTRGVRLRRLPPILHFEVWQAYTIVCCFTFSKQFSVSHIHVNFAQFPFFIFSTFPNANNQKQYYFQPICDRDSQSD